MGGFYFKKLQNLYEAITHFWDTQKYTWMDKKIPYSV